MASTTVVLPFALPPAELAPELSRNLQAPALATLLSHNNLLKKHVSGDENRILPHEAWLAKERGALAAAVMQGFGLAPKEGFWFIVHPVHIQLARNHLVLADARRLCLDQADSRVLFELAKPYFDELVWGDAETWFMRADGWQGLDAASPDAAMGSNLADWMPVGPTALAFKKLQNEIQMLWHEHAVNEARQQRGLAPVNSFWMWGGASGAAPPAACAPAQSLAVAAGAAPSWLAALGTPGVTAAPGGSGSVILPQLIPAGAGNDWGAWLGAMQQLEHEWFAPLLAALRDGRITELAMILTSRESWTEIRTSKAALRKFWRAQNLKNLTQ
ncbi:hypothetical protein SAMN05518865_11932 [Duganella sp. CF458]|uniref:hypothetical protein n=1 Tax=Duganella sp. CF458 TaxID=1884368 RepID=UPI0008F40560|nr:hypothetical protein [Duganella sp. CF458]SFG81030.1 hypothetical protein SAMN05518865_11932 [Duganella sp. CF458]